MHFIMLAPAHIPNCCDPAAQIFAVLSAPNIEDRRKEAGEEPPDEDTELMVDDWNNYQTPTKELGYEY